MQIKLESGVRILISPIDSDLFVGRAWWERFGYVRSEIRVSHRRHAVQLHRVVLERMLMRSLLPGEEVDHINRDPTDNRRENLRLASRSQNNANTRSTNAVGLRGVYLPSQKYQASIRIDKVKIHIGTYSSEEEAAWMYDQYAVALHGEFAVLNYDYI